jgi:hypothetical protein
MESVAYFKLMIAENYWQSLWLTKVVANRLTTFDVSKRLNSRMASIDLASYWR